MLKTSVDCHIHPQIIYGNEGALSFQLSNSRITPIAKQERFSTRLNYLRYFILFAFRVLLGTGAPACTLTWPTPGLQTSRSWKDDTRCTCEDLPFVPVLEEAAGSKEVTGSWGSWCFGRPWRFPCWQRGGCCNLMEWKVKLLGFFLISNSIVIELL